MGISVADNFDHKSKKPLDARVSYSTLALMKAVTDANIYEGCEAYCAETDKYYKFLSTNTVDAETGKWREREDSAGHIIEDSEGTSLTQRDTLQFSDSFSVSDDSTNKKTKVELDKLTSGEMGDIITPLPSYSGGSSNPTGTIIHFMGTIAPDGYLACDGSTKNIADYPRLANFFLAQFGSINIFGGNGTTTFAVPNLQGEFLRGTGTNSHSTTTQGRTVTQGNGAAVGTHQNATASPIPTVMLNSGATDGDFRCQGVADGKYYGISNMDSTVEKDSSETMKGIRTTGATSLVTTSGTSILYTTRPTNTSVLLCIKD